MKLRILILCSVLALIVPTFTRADMPTFGGRSRLGAINSDLIDEASGIAASRHNPGVIWIHNDAGDTARIFAINTDAKLLGIYNLKGSRVTAKDWEDIAIGPGPVNGKDYIYVGDIGNNVSKRNTIQVYRLPEPVVNNAQNPPNPASAPSFNVTANIERFDFRYPDGNHNAETLLVDPISRNIFIIAKTTTPPDSDNTKRVYVARVASLVTNATITLTHVATVVSKAPGSAANKPTAGDISADGSLIVMKNLTDVFIWPRQPGTTIEATLHANPLAPVIASKVKGEAITFDPDGGGYYAVSEGLNPPLYFVPRTN